MTALELISLITQVLFIGLFVVVFRHAARNPGRASFDTVLLFGSIAAVVAIGRVANLIGLQGDPAITSLSLIVLSIAPFAMLRLVDDFNGTPRWVQLVGGVAFVGVAALTIVGFPRVAELVELATIGFFVAVGGYAAVAFADASQRTRGITRRRMTAVAVGAALFIGAVVAAVVGALFPSVAPALGLVAQVIALVAVLAFFLGFAPPAWIRRAWREPDLRGFLERSVHLAGVDGERAAILRRLRDLVGALLDAQRLEQGRVVMDLEPADLCQIVESVRDRHGSAGTSVRVARPDRPLVGAVDRPRLEQVLENLVDNAMKYGSAGVPEIEIAAVDDAAQIAVVDHGVGIPEEDRDKIFERFFRASNVQSITDTGLGLGLYICRRIVNAHGGRIWHEPTPGGGSTFRISLPLQHGGAPADEATVAEPGWSSSLGSGAAADA